MTCSLRHLGQVEAASRAAYSTGLDHSNWSVLRTGDGRPAGAWSLDFPAIDSARYDARWVARFISAYLNEDEPTAQALVGAAHSDGRLRDCLLTLAGSTVATLHARFAEGA